MRDENVRILTCVSQEIRYGISFLQRFERSQLQSDRPTVFVGQKVIQFSRVRVHPADIVLSAIQLYRRDPLTWKRIHSLILAMINDNFILVEIRSRFKIFIEWTTISLLNRVKSCSSGSSWDEGRKNEYSRENFVHVCSFCKHFT